MQEKLHFRISSALKDIIGRDLITDDYIAVFELVKNAFDAYATKVEIYFENLNESDAKIIIKDNGKGMSYEDLLNKWLFVAYSAKKEGTEDDSLDYRNKIIPNRQFAGAKGIGRFSCDRLGKYLILETAKASDPPKKYEVLVTNWESFEADLQQEFVDVSVLHETNHESNYGLDHGTVLEISDLRSTWDRAKLIKLKDSLAKLISPNNTVGEDAFSIEIHAKEELEQDNKESDERNKVNGPVNNFIFEALGLKTTKITASISTTGEILTTELIDGGTRIYLMKEESPFLNLRGIDITLFYLNKAAKLTFARRMGLASRRYGHVFLYKNGFRIYPFGEPYEDPMKIDVRKSRKQYSYLGTGELMGQIDIKGYNPELKETSSRGNGLIKNDHYDELESYFFVILERLERYVVDVQQWGLSIEDSDVDMHVKDRIIKLINLLTGSSKIIDLDYPDNFLDILKDSQAGSADSLINDLQEIAFKSGNQKLIENTKVIASKFAGLKKAKAESDAEAKVERLHAKASEKKLRDKESENLFLKSVKSQDFDEIISFLHHIGISASINDNYLTGLIEDIEEDVNVGKAELLEILHIIVFENKKIQNISGFATKANFKLYTDAIELCLDDYLKEYIQNIVSVATNSGVDVRFVNKNNTPFIGKFRPIEINILVDNFLSNSKKAGASKFIVELEREGSEVTLSFEDNGRGIPEDKLSNIFEYGFTTNNTGSGLGLYHVREIVARMGGEMSVDSKPNLKTVFKIKLNEKGQNTLG